MLMPPEVDAFLEKEFPAAFRRGYRCDEIGDGFAIARWSYDEAELRPGGLISGPTQFGLADIALWFLSFTVLGLAPMAVTTDMHISFLRPATGGDVLARAELMRAGKTRITGTVTLWVEGARDRPVSHVTGSYAVLG